MGSETAFEISEIARDDQSISLKVHGDLTVETSPYLQKKLKKYFDQKPKQIHLMLDDVARMDSSGIATLVDGLRWSRSSGNHFVLSGLTEAVQDIFAISKLDREFEVLSGAINS